MATECPCPKNQVYPGQLIPGEQTSVGNNGASLVAGELILI